MHHAGLLPKYRLLVEQLAQRGLLFAICGTDTLGVGVNVPIRTVVFTRLCKYDGRKTGILSVRDFKQIAGRAGRKGFDESGSVVCQAPEHVIENVRLRAKAEGDAKKQRKLKLRKAPDKRYAHWDDKTFERLAKGEPELLESSFNVTHSMMLAVMDRPDGDGCRRMKQLLRASHLPPRLKFAQGRRAIAMFRSLLDSGVVELSKKDGRSYVDVKAELQKDFSLHQNLSLYVVEAIEALDREEESYAWDVISFVEATLEDPTAVLMRQLDKKKGDLIAEWKAQRVEYDERMKRLEEVVIDKPNLETILAIFEEFKLRHPVLADERIRPKSVVRDMLERGYGFVDYIKEYGLSRGEGVLLRYLSNAFKAMVQSVPEEAKTDHFYDLSDELGGIVRDIDSSLIDEWERMKRGPEEEVAPEPDEPEGPPDVTKDVRAFTAAVRTGCYRILRCLALERWEDVKALTGWDLERQKATLMPYFEHHECILMDANARSPRNTLIEKTDTHWTVRQVLVDPDEQNDWSFVVRVDLTRSREESRPVLELLSIAES
ncbi:MAG TPA: DUF3516 domain-containing protein [Polyangiaceae bacterium]|nr:DUF3516 domain-containing protein [Polyangiaceae bacterium]